MKKTILASLVALLFAGCDPGYCVSYTISEVWIENGTSAPLYYTFSDNPYLTPDCWVRELPVKLADICDYQRFSPSQVLANPTYTANGYNTGGDDLYHHYMLLLRYDNTVVACYDVRKSALAAADYPWFSSEPDNVDRILDNNTGDCIGPETTYKYTYYITDDIL